MEQTVNFKIQIKFEEGPFLIQNDFTDKMSFQIE